MQCDEEEESWICKNHTFAVKVREEGEHEGKSRKGLKVMNSAETQREWMEQWCERGVRGNLNVTFATQEALIRSREFVPRVKGSSAQGERKGL